MKSQASYGVWEFVCKGLGRNNKRKDNWAMESMPISAGNLGQSKCHVQPDKNCECEKNRGEIPLPCRHKTRDGSTAATLGERELRGCSIEHLAKDEFCKDNHYM